MNQKSHRFEFVRGAHKMPRRKIIHIKGIMHQNPIPTAVRIDNMVFTSAVIGSDPRTGKMPDLVSIEVANIFYYLHEIMNHYFNLPVKVRNVRLR